MANSQNRDMLKSQLIEQLFYIPGVLFVAIFSNPFLRSTDAPVVKTYAGIMFSKCSDLRVPGCGIAPYAAQHQQWWTFTIEPVVEIDTVAGQEMHAETSCCFTVSERLLVAGQFSTYHTFGNGDGSIDVSPARRQWVVWQKASSVLSRWKLSFSLESAFRRFRMNGCRDIAVTRLKYSNDGVDPDAEVLPL